MLSYMADHIWLCRIWLIIYDWPYMVDRIWSLPYIWLTICGYTVYDWSYMIDRIWLTVYDHYRICSHIWLIIYGCTVYDWPYMIITVYDLICGRSYVAAPYMIDRIWLTVYDDRIWLWPYMISYMVFICGCTVYDWAYMTNHIWSPYMIVTVYD